MKTWLFFIGVITLLMGLWDGVLEAFELQYPGDSGFFIGKPMVYLITGDSNGLNIGKEGTFTFGQGRINIGGVEYHDCVFLTPSGESHFYLKPDPVGGDLVQKGFKVGATELTLDPAVKSIDYPVSPGKSWTETTNLTAKDIEIPGLGRLPIPISVKGAKFETKVFSTIISVPAGTFDTLLVESTFSGTVLGIPMTLMQRTWLSEDSVPVKRNFEFTLPTPMMMYEIELSKLTATPWDLNWDGIVDIVDLVMVARNFGKRIEKIRIPNPDIDGNGNVDIFDIAKVGVHLGESYKPLE